MSIFSDKTTIDLERFLKAQEHSYETAKKEIKNGKKQSHWMWYIFPQIKGLGFSSTAKYYAIQNREEAEAYLSHTILGQRLKEMAAILLELNTNNAYQIFGDPDDKKLRSSMTLFYLISGDKLFKNVIHKYFQGTMDELTIPYLEHL